VSVIDAFNLFMYGTITMLAWNAWAPFVTFYNRVVIELEHLARAS
jgi:hypothetical protein